jgi:hypothetical protein
MGIRNSLNATNVNSPSFVALQYAFKETIREELIIEQENNLFFAFLFHSNYCFFN